MTSQEDFLSGGNSYPAIKFDTMGEVHRGMIIEEPSFVTRPTLNDPNIKEENLVVNLDVNGQNRSLWVSKFAMKKAIKDALTEAGPGTLLQVGGELGIAWTEEVDTGKASKAKIFVAKYVAPKATAGISAAEIF